MKLPDWILLELHQRRGDLIKLSTAGRTLAVYRSTQCCPHPPAGCCSYLPY